MAVKNKERTLYCYSRANNINVALAAAVVTITTTAEEDIPRVAGAVLGG